MVASLTGACSNRGLPPPDVIARIGGQELPYADFENYLRENTVDSETGLSSEILSSLFDQYLDEALLGRLAVDEGHAGENDLRQQAIEAMVQDMIPSELSEAEIAEFFSHHRSDFHRQEGVILRQILVEERAVAEMALQAIKSGMVFEEAARTYSQGPGAELGGLQGELSRIDLPPAFADLIFALDVGEVSEIVAADYGFHLFQVIEKRSEAEPTLDEVRDVIVDRLRQESRVGIMAQLVERARSSYNVSIYVRNLPFNYAGSRR
jgi:parvulin-like peptidyl-prolyl isomerase